MQITIKRLSSLLSDYQNDILNWQIKVTTGAKEIFMERILYISHSTCLYF